MRDRNNNVNSCKAAIRDWVKFDPPLPLEKQFRGFNNVTSGRLLCPALYDYDNPMYVFNLFVPLFHMLTAVQCPRRSS